MRLSIALLALTLIAAGCCSRAAPLPDPPGPADDLQRGTVYLWEVQTPPVADKFTAVTSATSNTWSNQVISGGDPLAVGRPYIVPILIADGGVALAAEVVKATPHAGGWLIEDERIPLSLTEVAKYQKVTKARFWQIVINTQPFSEGRVLHLRVPAHYTDGTSFVLDNYYRITP